MRAGVLRWMAETRGRLAAGVLLRASLVLLAACTVAPQPATLEVMPTGNPPIERGFGGYRIEATLIRDGTIIGTWEPGRLPSVSVDAGDYVLVIVYRSVSDAIVCTTGGPNPTCIEQTGTPIELCQTTLTLEPNEDRRLSVDLGVAGPDCHVTS
jgi:hypothetical protein